MPEDVSKPPDFRPSGIRFERTVTMGNLLTMLGGFVMAAAAFADYRVEMDRHEMRITQTEVQERLTQAQLSESLKAQSEMIRAIDRLTYQLQSSKPTN